MSESDKDRFLKQIDRMIENNLLLVQALGPAGQMRARLQKVADAFAENERKRKYLIVDDPDDPDNEMTPSQRAEVLQWYEGLKREKDSKMSITELLQKLNEQPLRYGPVGTLAFYRDWIAAAGCVDIRIHEQPGKVFLYWDQGLSVTDVRTFIDSWGVCGIQYALSRFPS